MIMLILKLVRLMRLERVLSVSAVFVPRPYTLYFQPVGKSMCAKFLFFAYLAMFSYILFERPTIYDVPQAFVEDGLKDFLADWTNYVDMAIGVNFALQIAHLVHITEYTHADTFLIFLCVRIFDDATQYDNGKIDEAMYNYNSGLPMADYQKCPTTQQIGSTNGYWLSSCNATFADWRLPDEDTAVLCDFASSSAFYLSAAAKCNCWKQLDHYLSDSCCRQSDSIEAVLFNFLYGLNAILLWTRTLYFSSRTRRWAGSSRSSWRCATTSSTT